MHSARHGRDAPRCMLDRKASAEMLRSLRVGIMRRMIGRDHVDSAVGHRGVKRFEISLAAQRRIHLRVRSPFEDRMLVEPKMMRRHLAGDMRAIASRVADQLDRLGAREMRDMHAAPRCRSRARDRGGCARSPQSPDSPSRRGASTPRRRWPHPLRTVRDPLRAARSRS